MSEPLFPRAINTSSPNSFTLTRRRNSARQRRHQPISTQRCLAARTCTLPTCAATSPDRCIFGVLVCQEVCCRASHKHLRRSPKPRSVEQALEAGIWAMMMAALQRPVMAEVIQLPACCRNHAGHTSRTITPGAAGELLSSNCLGSQYSAQIQPVLAAVSISWWCNCDQTRPSLDAVVQLLARLAEFGRRLSKRPVPVECGRICRNTASSAGIGRCWAELRLPEQLFDIRRTFVRQLLDNFGAPRVTVGGVRQASVR